MPSGGLVYEFIQKHHLNDTKSEPLTTVNNPPCLNLACPRVSPGALLIKKLALPVNVFPTISYTQQDILLSQVLGI